MLQTADCGERSLLLASLCYCADSSGDEMLIMCCDATGSGSCPVAGCVISGFEHLVRLRREFFN